ncbi:MAG: hypothetical protein FJY92_01050, partial [Candidatus Hydrogenedentes bacterium]|nr:hypothetical protein [Candidatus Hydrogenedentota bacterium]
FHASGRTFLVIGADTKDESIVPIFEAETPQLDKWTYRGILYRQPKSSIQFFECPNFFPLDGKWVLVFSPYKPLRYLIGTFDIEQYAFAPEKESTLDYGSFYASNIYFGTGGPRDAKDYRPTVLVGWIRGFKGGLGWNGCMSLPRELAIGSDGYLRQTPIKALDTLKSLTSPSGGPDKLIVTSMFSLEWSANVSGGGSLAITLTPRTPGAAPVRLRFRNDAVVVDDIEAKWTDPEFCTSINVRCYVDNTTLELICSRYKDDASNMSGSIAVSKVIEFSPDGYDVHFEKDEGALLFHVTAGNRKPVGGE